jgi:hypothetical protein
MNLMKFKAVTIGSMLLGSVLMLLSQTRAWAQENAGQENIESLAQKSQNPIADIISVPFQYNANFNVGPYDRVQSVINIQPVVPVKLTDDLNLVCRTIIPLIDQPEFTKDQSIFGLGDIMEEAFLSPSKENKVMWGVGTALSFPTATDSMLGAGKWSAGPAAVLVTTPKPWVIGMITYNMWSFAGDGNRADVNQFDIQYFVNYNLPKGWFLSNTSQTIANWGADPGNRWLVPLGGGVGKVFRVGRQPVSVVAAAFYNVVHPDYGPDWQARVTVALLYPAHPKPKP